MSTTPQNEYIARINKVLDYIEKNITESFTLEELASEASFSRFHFNRIFRAFTGETPFQFITRVRLEKAATLLVIRHQDSVTDIAFACGYTDLAVFSRNFKSQFGVSASQYRLNKGQQSNMRQTDGKQKQPGSEVSAYFCFNTNQMKWRTHMNLNKSIEVQEMPAMTVAYIRHTGPYQGNEKLFENLWNRLFAWAGPRGLIGGPGFKSLIIYHDDPNITAEEKLRMSVCITVPPDTRVEGEVGKMEMEKGTYVIARFEVDATQFGEAWSWLYGEWFPKSGYQPDDRPCFEMYPEEPRDGKFIVDICVPVKPL
ncbi:MAG TPA: AraC family transcriptional regulator [Bacteroidales bacterium]|nr:AraC family transcriptional regulator [Bacteroidales bacterium]HRZ48079.1 AraC family transcriptional regulator [Bacteroidales bacterium]